MLIGRALLKVKAFDVVVVFMRSMLRCTFATYLNKLDLALVNIIMALR